jgi:hypothetical protein
MCASFGGEPLTSSADTSSAQSDLMSYLQGLAGGDPLFSGGSGSGSGSVVVPAGGSTTITLGSGPSTLGGGTTDIIFH